MRPRAGIALLCVALLWLQQASATEPITAGPLWLTVPADASRIEQLPGVAESGHVTVVSLLAANSGYSRRQAVALDELRQAFVQHSLPLHVIGINGRHVSAQLMYSQLEGLVNYTVYQATHDKHYWSQLGGLRDDVFIYDTCGRLTFYLPFPHSYGQNKFIRLAVESTYYDSPCGPPPNNDSMVIVGVRPMGQSSNPRSLPRRRPLLQRKCHCIEGSPGSVLDQHCLCKSHTPASTYQPTGATNEACFCKWTRAEMNEKCRCHHSEAGRETCHCTLGTRVGDPLGPQSCFWQESPEPYGSFAPEVGVVREAFCTPHGQPLLWRQAGAPWRWLQGQSGVTSSWRWQQGQAGGATSSWRWEQGQSDGATSSWRWEQGQGGGMTSSWRWDHGTGSQNNNGGQISWRWSEGAADRNTPGQRNSGQGRRWLWPQGEMWRSSDVDARQPWGWPSSGVTQCQWEAAGGGSTWAWRWGQLDNWAGSTGWSVGSWEWGGGSRTECEWRQGSNSWAGGVWRNQQWSGNIWQVSGWEWRDGVSRGWSCTRTSSSQDWTSTSNNTSSRENVWGWNNAEWQQQMWTSRSCSGAAWGTRSPWPWQQRRPSAGE